MSHRNHQREQMSFALTSLSPRSLWPQLPKDVQEKATRLLSRLLEEYWRSGVATGHRTGGHDE